MSVLTNYEINWNEFLRFSGNGVSVATYAEIYKALVLRFKDIWGEDIDLSSASADGVFVSTYALVINNVLQSFKSFYESLNVNTATGKYLDILCNLTNVTRKQATASTCPVVLTLDESEETYTTTEINLLDINGNIWYAKNLDGFTLEPGVPQTIVFKCQTLGSIEAPTGSIDRTVNNDVNIKVSQDQNANAGFDIETDANLRQRRTQSLGARGTTVLENLSSSLLELTGVRDVKIYNNDTNEEIKAKDETVIVPHNIYIVLRTEPNITISDSTIGTIIYEKMTPGISTTAMSGSIISGVAHSFQYVQRILGQSIDSDIKQIVYWKDATPVNPEITIKLQPNVYYAFYDDTTSKKIANAVISLLNNKSIGTNIKTREVWQTVLYADSKFRGSETYEILDVKVNGEDTYINSDTYYKYNYYKTNLENGVLTITIN